MAKPTYLQIQVSREFKDKLKKAAEVRGITMSAYVLTKIHDHIMVDLGTVVETREKKFLLVETSA